MQTYIVNGLDSVFDEHVWNGRVQPFKRWVQGKSKQIVEIGLKSRRAISTTNMRIKRQLYLLKHPISISFHSHKNSLGIKNPHKHSQTHILTLCHTQINIHTYRDINIFMDARQIAFSKYEKIAPGGPNFKISDWISSMANCIFYRQKSGIVFGFRPFYCIKRAEIPISPADKHHLKP